MSHKVLCNGFKLIFFILSKKYIYMSGSYKKLINSQVFDKGGALCDKNSDSL